VDEQAIMLYLAQFRKFSPKPVSLADRFVAYGDGLVAGVVEETSQFLVVVPPDGTDEKLQVLVTTSTGVVVPHQVEEMSDQLAVTYTPTVAGTHSVSILVGGNPIHGSPFSAEIMTVGDEEEVGSGALLVDLKQNPIKDVYVPDLPEPPVVDDQGAPPAYQAPDHPDWVENEEYAKGSEDEYKLQLFQDDDGNYIDADGNICDDYGNILHYAALQPPQQPQDPPPSYQPDPSYQPAYQPAPSYQPTASYGSGSGGNSFSYGSGTNSYSSTSGTNSYSSTSGTNGYSSTSGNSYSSGSGVQSYSSGSGVQPYSSGPMRASTTVVIMHGRVRLCWFAVV
jgi:hypothetical protein